MCEDRAYMDGIIAGLEIGDERMATLCRQLFSENRIDDVERICNDPEFKEQLYNECNKKDANENDVKN